MENRTAAPAANDQKLVSPVRPRLPRGIINVGTRTRRLFKDTRSIGRALPEFLSRSSRAATRVTLFTWLLSRFPASSKYALRPVERRDTIAAISNRRGERPILSVVPSTNFASRTRTARGGAARSSFPAEDSVRLLPPTRSDLTRVRALRAVATS